MSRRSLPSYAFALLASFALVVLCFGASVVYANAQMRDVEARSQILGTEVEPAIEHLAVLRTRLRDLKEALASEPRTRLLGRIDAEWDAYEGAIPATSVSELRDRAFVELTRLRAAVEQHAGDEDVREAIDRTDHACRSLISKHAADAAFEVRAMDSSSHRSSTMSLALGAVSLAVAVLLALFSFEAVRRHSQILEERAYELELFASRVAHDLRGPLTAPLVALRDVGRDLPEEDPLQRGVVRGQRSLALALSMIDDLLLFACRGARPEPGARAPLRSGIDSVVAEIEPLASAKGITLSASAGPDCEVACAPGVLGSLLQNLVRNAVKYIGEGEVKRIEVAALDKGTSVRVEVADTGPGLPEGKERVVFEPYVRGRTDGAGLGLGLATVKRLCEGHGGSTGVTSRPGEGCTFWFELPKAGRRTREAKTNRLVGTA